MNKCIKSIFLSVLAISVAATQVSAHVTVNPREAVVGYSVATVRVPNEKDVPTTAVRLVVPDGVIVHGVKPVPGWSFAVTRESASPTPGEEGQVMEDAGHGHEASEGQIVEVAWSGGQIGVGEFMEFPLSVEYKAAGDISWSAYQTYADGEIVPWDASSTERPASKVEVLSEPKVDTVANDVATLGANQKSDPSLWFSVGAILLSAASLFLTLRKR